MLLLYEVYEIIAENNLNSNLSDHLDWKLLKSVTGNTSVTLPSDFSELLVEVEAPSSADYSYTFNILKSMLKTTNKRFFNGFYQTSNTVPTYGTCKLSVSLTTLKLTDVLVNSEKNVSSECTVSVYYR